jgi:hypothetical protein
VSGNIRGQESRTRGRCRHPGAGPVARGDCTGYWHTARRFLVRRSAGIVANGAPTQRGARQRTTRLQCYRHLVTRERRQRLALQRDRWSVAGMHTGDRSVCLGEVPSKAARVASQRRTQQLQ